MKTYKLTVHQKAFSSSELIVNIKDFPKAIIGDIVEVYHSDSEQNKLLLQIMAFKDDLQSKDTISIEHSVASLFQLHAYSDVTVNIVSPESVILDSVELTFRDQYLGRSEMWRLRNSMIDTCVYNNKKMEFCGGYTRVQVYQMWTKGKIVSCGVISHNTKIVFRSATSMVYIFLQMTSEMWEFNFLGDTYFEKSVDGFLFDLFEKWRYFGSNHEVTLVVFSRVFYKANKLEEFPEAMRECLQVDYKNRFYEDFYRVVIQNERYEDWAAASLMLLRRLYYTYKIDILNYHHKVLHDSGVSISSIPEAYLSHASQGNFLEVLNMALNVFEKHYIERSLDRTGQLAIVISPGMGEFYVDRQLTNITKQRVMDNGVGIDLICVGQEPLYAVPLFLFQNRDESLGDDCSIPHWINLSFYRSNHMPQRSTFVPRIKVPNQFSNILLNRPKMGLRAVSSNSLTASLRNKFTNTAKDYMNYDVGVFDKKHKTSMPRFGNTNNILPQNKLNGISTSRKKKFSSCSFDVNSGKSIALSRSLSPLKQRSITPPPKSQCEFINLPPLNRNRSRSIDESLKMYNKSGLSKQDAKNNLKFVRVRGLINPFDKSRYNVKLTSNRRRWSHTFPEKPKITKKVYDDIEIAGNTEDLCEMENIQILEKKLNLNIIKLQKYRIEEKQNITSSCECSSDFELTNMCTPGVDWKSLVFPACLPITTDYFPDEVNLQSYYLFSNYNLLPDYVNAEVALQRAVYRQPLSALEVFYQMICQRLSQGFQLVVSKDENPEHKKKINSIVMRSTVHDERFIEMRLSIGRIVHTVTLFGSEIQVTRYRPRFPYATFEIQYRYRFQAPDHSTYGISWISFITEKLENFNWNYMDHYLCARGDMDYDLHEKLKYWRFRMYLLPWRQDATKTIMSHLDDTFYCDIYKIPTMKEQVSFTNKFVKFIETWVNRIKRSTTVSLKSSSDTSPYRDRVNSIRPLDKPRPRSGSNVYDKAIVSLFPENPVQDEIIDDIESPINLINTELLKENISNVELVEHLCNTQVGVGFVNRHMGLPQNTFVSNDAITWLMNNLKTLNNRDEAVQRLQDILCEGLICHASGDFSHPFIDGFYLYYFPSCESPTGQPSFPTHDFQAFENEWVEVEVKQPIDYPKNIDFLMDNLSLPESLHHGNSREVPWYKEAHLEMDVNSKSDLVEWGHARYQSLYRCDQAYEIIARWVAASGSVVADLVYNWARKAQTGGFQLIPLPADPFALPYTLKSDPLRGPVFVPLNLECLLTEGKNCLFHEYPEDSWLRRLLLFQEVILYRFGFVICNSKTDGNESYHNQYIHLTGNVFVLILSDLIEETKEKNDSPDQGLNELEASGNQQELQFSPHMEYISRHVYHSKENDPKIEKRVGFLWAWNHMVSRRWKSSNPATGDEQFQNKLLEDFRYFCSNKDERLSNFWKSCKDEHYAIKHQE
ncbi:GATOR complex protein DEPDC5 isoform X1 [Myzus persicae]|uniref:GATOR complex protein DEPDC5 isoform X1 n=1 Tax=Myzus persicae TaxID=13164 RepID=UPI000B93324C|nr:GATOR complex protein DEPDC5 isoform X1 [Myzus persicae]